MPTDIETTLLPDEAKDLARCEAVIQRGLDTFYAVGEALRLIRTDKLYRADFATFDAYCAARWGVKRPQPRRDL